MAEQFVVRTLSQLKSASQIQGAHIVVINDINIERDSIRFASKTELILHAKLYNGTIVGNNTEIKSNDKGLFEQVWFEGSFKGKPDIAWFNLIENIEYDNSRELNSALQLTYLSSQKDLALPSRCIYYVKSTIENSRWRDFLRTGTVEIKSGVTFDLNGSTLRCIPNKSHQYNILFAREASDIVIKNGIIQGDRPMHLGSCGEWGYGIELQGVKNFRIENIECFDCWGDGIDIQVSRDGDGIETSEKTKKGHCLNGNIVNVYCHDNRRQGMSVQGIIGLKVYSSRFSCSRGTNPQSGVDIEPYTPDNVVSHVVFDGCQFDNNINSGIVLDGNSISDVELSDCSFGNNKGWDLSLQGNNIRVLRCKGVKNANKPSIRIVGKSSNIDIQECELQSIYAQGFSHNLDVEGVIVKGCSFSWNGRELPFGFSDDNSLNVCTITYENCLFDFSSGQFIDGNLVYKSGNQRYDYIYRGCEFNVGKNNLRITNSQSFYKCIFNDCASILFVGSSDRDNKLSLKNCMVNGLTSKSYVNFYAPVDNLLLQADLDGTTFETGVILSNQKVFGANRKLNLRVKGIKRSSCLRVIDSSSNIKLINN